MKKSSTKVHSIEVLTKKLNLQKSAPKQGSVSQAQGFYVV
jgi:hypothetical protein